ncbi:DUF3231 family protein [Paenibacillus sp. J22TS3]|uniref:DUF3231 family protein n=1 Tax=Paenibacillus sp. J22TS3 TaxID=2807192 RepID=UPI001B2CF045|nr:DUF3231 family protein [Paenibacillus sp. J22TS3]GIP24183.1 hypothetical protein J22TS3_44580 [Paenibacillus sp. J22TS3]
MAILGGNPKDEPLHYGEIFGVWQCSTKGKGSLSSFQAYLNHAGDKDLKDILKDLIDQTTREIKEADEILLANGIPPVPAFPERPPADLEEIPVGARFSDPEIGAAVATAVSMGIVEASQVIAISIREDIGALFLKNHGLKAALGARILRLLKDKGWLVPPPLQIKRPDGE